MGKKKQHKQQQPDDGVARTENGHEIEPVVRLLALHGKLVAVAVGTSFRVLDWSTGAEVCSNDEHTAAIRVLEFSDDGAQLLTAGDDKQVKLWDTSTWQCARTLVSNKKTSAAALTRDGRYTVFADKFGDVCIGTTGRKQQQQQQQQQQQEGEQQGGDQQQQQQQQQQQAAPAGEDPAPLLGHMQAIVTSALVLPGDNLVVTTDRDSKVRVSVLERPNPLVGSFRIQSYCLGHREFAACATEVPPAPGADASGPAGGALLLTGGGEGCVKLWDPVTGGQLASYQAVTEEQAAAAAAAAGGGQDAQEQQAAGGEDGDGEAEGGEGEGGGGEGEADAEGGEEEGGEAAEEAQRQEAQRRRKERKRLLPVVALALAPAGDLLAVLVEGLREVQLVRVDRAARALGPCVQRLAVPGDVTAPSRASFDGEGRLWLVGGPPVPVATSAHVAVAAPQGGGDGGASYSFVTADALPAAARAFLERRDAEEEAVADAAVAAGVTYTMQLRKRHYDPKQVEERKKQRTDKWESERLERMRQKEAAVAGGTGGGADA